METEKKPIYCPLCNRKVATWNKKSKMDIISKCRKCNKRVIFRVESQEIEIKNIPPRSQSSGVNFSY